MSKTSQETHNDVVAVTHRNWLNDGLTKTSQHIVDKQIERITELLASSSMQTDVSNETVRHYAVQLKTLKTLRKVLYDTPTFVANS